MKLKEESKGKRREGTDERRRPPRPPLLFLRHTLHGVYIHIYIHIYMYIDSNSERTNPRERE